MKTNTFVVTDGDEIKKCGLRDFGGNRSVGLSEDPELEIIRSIDEERMSTPQIYARMFISFLGNRRLNVESLKSLPVEEQNRLKREFLESV